MSVLTPGRRLTPPWAGTAQPRHLTQPTRGRQCCLPEDVQTIPGHVRSMGISMWASKGAGKSRTLGRLIAWQDFYCGVPLVVLDPVGEMIDNFLDKLVHLPPAERIDAWSRVRYVNLAGQDGAVMPWPLYAEAYSGERVSARAQRYVDVLERVDPAQRQASIEGMNTLSPLARAAGIVLSALGLGITEAWSLVHEPARWEPRLTRVAATHPETAAAVADLRALAGLRLSDQAARQRALESKLSLFRHFPQFAAMFGAMTPGIVWEEVIEQGQAVLLDFRGIDSSEHKRFCLLWVYHSLLTYIRRRGPGRHRPVSLVIDELPYLVGSAGVSMDILTTNIDELINRIARSHAVWLTIAGQELFQLPEPLRQTVLAVGTVLLGRTSDHKTAKELAERYYPFEPSCPYKIERVYGVIEDAVPGTLFHPAQPARHGAVDFRTEDVSREGQIALNSRRFLTLLACLPLSGLRTP